MIPIRDTPQGATFTIRVQPRARKTAITGTFGEGENTALKLAINAPPIDGRANEAVIEFFAELFAIPRAAIQILAGEKSRTKLIRIEGKSAEEITAALTASEIRP